ncbi:hypothetical protein CWO90_04325 [Bradyrhizobium sp. Leo121]|nr:hypothetical protein CWO90_04325 [Bradyrhizobium sp. Leo121]
MKFKRPPSDCQPQIQHLDLSSAENMADSIALLRDENDRLRRMVALLSAETEYIRRSLSSSVSTHWRSSSRLRALP